MRILQIENPKRDKNGWYTHPQCPNWDEGTTKAEQDDWLLQNKFTIDMDRFEFTASDELTDAWGEGLCDCSKWDPKSRNHGAILMSIHDTDDGPVAFYLVPMSPTVKWIDVSVLQPQSDFSVIACCDDDVEQCIYREYDDGVFWFEKADGSTFKATHWQSKPGPA